MFRGYSVGAVDFLFKPIVPEVLRSKVRVFVDLHWATEQVRRQAEQLRENERREMEHRLAEERRRAEEERWQLTLRIARDIQQKLFPAAPPSCPGFEIGGTSHPAELTGGDYFDYIPLLGRRGRGRRRRCLRPRLRPGPADGGDAGLPAGPGADQPAGRRHPHPGQPRPRRGRRRRPVRHPVPGPPRSGHADPGLRQRRTPARLCPAGTTGRSASILGSTGLPLGIIRRRRLPRGGGRRARARRPRPAADRRHHRGRRPRPDATSAPIVRSTSSGPTATSPRAGSSRPSIGPCATSPAGTTSSTT